MCARTRLVCLWKDISHQRIAALWFQPQADGASRFNSPFCLVESVDLPAAPPESRRPRSYQRMSNVWSIEVGSDKRACFLKLHRLQGWNQISVQSTICRDKSSFIIVSQVKPRTRRQRSEIHKYKMTFLPRRAGRARASQHRAKSDVSTA